MLLILQFQPAALDEGGQNVDQNNYPEKPLLSRILMDTISLLRKSHKSSWEKIKTVIHDMQMQFSPPNLEYVKRFLDALLNFFSLSIYIYIYVPYEEAMELKSMVSIFSSSVSGVGAR